MLATGCSTQLAIPHVPSVKITTSVDYSRFGDFFITEANSVSFPYAPVASVQTTHVQGVDGQLIDLWTMKPVGEVKHRKTIEDDVYGTETKGQTPPPVVSKDKAEVITLEGTLEALVAEAEKLGANGVINLKIRMINNFPVEGTTLQHGYEISGMAIKRLL